MNVIARLEYELAYYDSAVHRFNHYTTRTLQGSKRLCRVLLWEGAGDRTKLKYFDPKVMAVSVVSSSFSRAAQLEPWSQLCWVLVFLTTSRLYLLLQLYSPELNCPQLSNSSALYYLQTPTQWYGHASTSPQFLPISGDRDVSLPLSLEWPVWLSSSGNNCHAVQRSLSSGASVYESIMGFFFFTSSHFISQYPPTRFPLITAIRMCHFLPVHHPEWHFWPGQKVKTSHEHIPVISICNSLLTLDDEFFSNAWFFRCLNAFSSSSSSYRAGSTDIPDPLSPLLPIVHRPR